jgi:hypothetical protein
MRRQVRHAVGAVARAGLAWITVVSCVPIDTAPGTAAAIEFAPFPAPAVVVGDTLRDEAGRVAPIRAIVRNISGGALDDVPVRYLVPDSTGRTRLRVDSLTGVVRGDSVTTAPVRLVARSSDQLQVSSPGQGRQDGGLWVVPAPDTAGRGDTRLRDTVTIAQIDSLPADLRFNVSAQLAVTVRGAAVAGQRPAIPRWVVRYVVVDPPNPTNDSTQTYFVIDRESSTRRASEVDTTDQGGAAARALRIRGSRVAQSPATVTVEARVSHRGRPVAGSPVRFVVVVRRPGG